MEKLIFKDNLYVPKAGLLIGKILSGIEAANGFETYYKRKSRRDRN